MARQSALLLLCLMKVALAQSPYIGQESRDIRSLSASEVEAYLAGDGMGFAKAAELNQYPGPKHVLELADELALTDEQRSQTQSIFDEMEEQASMLGAKLVAQERALDRRFADRSIDAESLDALLSSIGDIRTAIRKTHLDAHLHQLDVLREEQIRDYNRHRGYQEHHNHEHDARQSVEGDDEIAGI